MIRDEKNTTEESKSGEEAKEGQSERKSESSFKPIDLEKLLREDLFIIGNIEPDEDNLLSFSDFDRMFRIIQKHATFRVC